MNHSPKRAFGSTEKARRKAVNLDLSTARRMVPLVRSIIRDILASQEALNRLEPEHERLESFRRDLPWQQRRRRYQIQEEIAQVRRDLAAALAELKALGVSLTDRERGGVDFPTRVNGRPAAYSWLCGEDDIAFWHYSGEEVRRPIPPDWLDPAPAKRAKWKP
ncbi:MAG TPA: DUF2203 family protein [Gemmataceae bacterium]